MRLLASIGMATLLCSSSCAAPDLTTTTFTCQTDLDCKDGLQCGSLNGKRACVAKDTSPIRIGMSAPFQGVSADLGTEMRRGILAHFDAVNLQGGVGGRKLELDSRNDNYDPDLALTNVKSLLDIRQAVVNPDKPDVRGSNSVIALLGNVGTPPMLKTAPLCTKNEVVFFAPFTGAQKYLRDDTNSPYVFNYRAGYYEETAAMVEYMYRRRTPRIIADPGKDFAHIVAFTQDDTYGDAGYAGLENAYNTRVGPLPAVGTISRVKYTRNDIESAVPAATAAQSTLAAFVPLGKTSIAIVMIDTYGPGARFIQLMRDWINADAQRSAMLDVLFIHVSFVGSDALAKGLTTLGSYTDIVTGNKRTYAEGVMVTQVVPHYQSQLSGVAAYRKDLTAHDGGSFNWTSLEGYIAARLFVEGLRLSSTFDGPTLAKTFETKVTKFDLGIGANLGFGATSHQASHTVWGSIVRADGTFAVDFTWTKDGIVGAI